MHLLRIATVALSAGVMLCGCDPAPSHSTVPAAQPEKPSLATEVEAEAERFAEWLQKDRARVVQEIALKEFALQSRLLEVSGIAEEFGGPERANAALRNLMVAVEASGAPPDLARWTRVDNSDQISGAFNVAQAAVEIAAVVREFANSYGEGAANTTKSPPTDTKGAELSVADGSIEYTSATNVTDSGLSGKFSLHMKVNACPNAAGEILLELTGRAATSSVKSGRGANTDFKATARRTLDEDAHFDTLDLKAELQSAEFGGGSVAFIDMKTRLDTEANVSDTQVRRRSSKASDADVANGESLLKYIELLALHAVNETESVWGRGKCIKIDTESAPGARSGLKPSTSFSLNARPRSKLDGSAVGGTVRATLAGDSSLDPANTKVRADGKFTYVAPGEKDKVAAVSFEARSKRGVGLATLDFDTKAARGYTMRGGAKELRFSGDICDLEDQFYLHSEGENNRVDMRFDPKAKDHGIYSYSGTMTGYDKGEKFTFRVHGKGTYQVKFEGDVAVSARTEGVGTVETPFGPQTGSGREEYTLTPLDRPDCSSNAEVATMAPVGGG